MSHSIRTQLIALFMAFAVVPLLFVGIILTWQAYRYEQIHAQQLQRAISERASSQIQAFIQQADQELYRIIQTADFVNAVRSQQEDLLLQEIFYRNLFDELAVINRVGQEQARVSRLGITPVADLRTHAQSDAFRLPMQTNKTYYGPVHFNQVNKEPMLIMAVPTLDARTGETIGVLLAEVRLRQVLEQVTNIQFGRNGLISVIDGDGRLIAHRDPVVLENNIPLSIDRPDGFGLGTTGASAFVTTHMVNSGNPGLYVVAELPLREALIPFLTTITITGLALLITGISASTLVIPVANRLVKPLCDLADATQAISAGDLTRQVAVTRRDEVGLLQRHFNQMVVDLHEQHAAISRHREAIEQQNRELQASFATQQQLFQTIVDLSAPLIPVWDGVVVLPLIGHIDTRRGAEIIQTLLQGVVDRKARIAILDLTGVAMVDTQVVQVLMEATRSVSLMGTHLMLTGISPEMAQAIVEQRFELTGLSFYRDLRTATEAAVRQLGSMHNGGMLSRRHVSN